MGSVKNQNVGSKASGCARCHGTSHPIWMCPARPSTPNAPCPACKRGRHWKDECPLGGTRSEYTASVDGTNPFEFPTAPSSVSGMDDGLSPPPSTSHVQPEALLTGSLFHIYGELGDRSEKREMLVDCGSSVNLIPEEARCRAGALLEPCQQQRVYSFAGEPTRVMGQTRISTRLGDEKREVVYLVMDRLGKTILGAPALKAFGFSIDCPGHCLRFQTGQQLVCHNISQKN